MPADDPAGQDVVAARSRYDLVVQILRDITPAMRPADGLWGEAVALPSDLVAIGCATRGPHVEARRILENSQRFRRALERDRTHPDA